MTFRDFTNRTRTGAAPRVSIANYRATGASSAYAHLNAPMLAKFKWAQGVRVGFALGADNDAGWIRLAQDEDGCKFSAENISGGCRISIPCIGDGRPHKAHICEHRIENGALYIRLPSWCRTDFLEAA